MCKYCMIMDGDSSYCSDCKKEALLGHIVVAEKVKGILPGRRYLALFFTDRRMIIREMARLTGPKALLGRSSGLAKVTEAKEQIKTLSRLSLDELSSEGPESLTIPYIQIIEFIIGERSKKTQDLHIRAAGQNLEFALAEGDNGVLGRVKKIFDDRDAWMKIIVDDLGADELYERVHAYMRSGDYATAYGIVERYVQVAPRDARAYFAMAVIEVEKDLGPAIEHFRKAIEIDPANAAYHTNLADALLCRGLEEAKRGQDMRSLEEALAEAKEALRLDPSYHDAHYIHGLILAERGNIEEANREYALLYGVNPENPSLLLLHERITKNSPKARRLNVR